MSETDTQQLLQVKIISPKETLFEELVSSVSSTNSVGNFDILPQHANFITVVEKTPIIVRKPDKQVVTFNFPLAVIYAANNKVNIYTDIELSLVPA